MRRLSGEWRSAYPEHHFCAASLEVDELPFRDRRFECTTLIAVVEHLKRPQHILKQCYSFLDNDGNVIITTPSRLGEGVHRACARLGLASSGAVSEDEGIYSFKDIETLLGMAGFGLEHYRRFEVGMNQTFVCKKTLRRRNGRRPLV